MLQNTNSVTCSVVCWDHQVTGVFLLGSGREAVCSYGQDWTSESINNITKII